jgi:hypothetical protein
MIWKSIIRVLGKIPLYCSPISISKIWAIFGLGVLGADPWEIGQEKGLGDPLIQDEGKWGLI